MTRHFLDEGAQARFAEARTNAVRRIGKLARDEGASFVVVGGDAFDSNHVDRRTIVRALEALGDVPVPVFLLPGNHDPLNAASVYDSSTFRQRAPGNVHVLRDHEPVEVSAGIELVGAPWSTKRPLTDLVGDACSGLDPCPPGTHRVLVGHGAVDVGSPDATDPALIALDGLEAALDDGRVSFVALGDHHSTKAVGRSGRVWYAGSPEPTAFDEQDAGNVLLVDVGDDGVTVEPHRVATWRFVAHHVDVNGADDVARFGAWLEEHPDKDRTVLKLSFVGSVSLATKARLDGILEHARDVFAAVQLWKRHQDLVALPDDSDLERIQLSGFARAGMDRLRDLADAPVDEARTARDALGLLYRLAGGENA